MNSIKNAVRGPVGLLPLNLPFVFNSLELSHGQAQSNCFKVTKFGGV